MLCFLDVILMVSLVSKLLFKLINDYSIKKFLSGPLGMSRSDVEFSPFIFLLICHKSNEPIYLETESLITLINYD